MLKLRRLNVIQCRTKCFVVRLQFVLHLGPNRFYTGTGTNVNLPIDLKQETVKSVNEPTSGHVLPFHLKVVKDLSRYSTTVFLVNNGIIFLRTKTKVCLRDSTFVLSHVGMINNTSLA